MEKQYETVIGLEVHVELASATKIFCGCSTKFGGAPNTHTCPVCTGMPGSLPVLNKQVVEYALALGLAANCGINQHCRFDRKNYFYPDNPPSPSAPCPPKARLQADFAPQFDQAAYTAMVEKAKGYIREGDIFQVVLSNSLSAKMEGSLFDAYQILRRQNPSPYMFYFSSDDIEIAGASPETLVKLTDGKLFTYPLAGTRPRGKSPAEDAALEAGLLQDKKELSEHNMLVDLGRNDLGRVSTFGSVKVSAYHRILKFSHVMHIGSEVEGQLAPGKTALDAIEAVLPAGTLSGAPKFRAMQIIDELEGSKRGIYGGAIGYIDLAGNMDTCISIRIAYKKNGTVYIRSGAGIVADSVPEKEHTECINKAMAVVQAVRESAGDAQ